MDSDDIYKYLGLFVVVVFVVYIVIKTMNFQVKMVEGFTAPDAASSSANTDKNKVPDAIKSNTDKMSDALLTDKYLQAYEDTIMELDSNIDIYILSQVLANAESISADPGSTANQIILSKLNNAKTFSDTLNHAMKTLDKK
jgi:hypothetical protein